MYNSQSGQQPVYSILPFGKGFDSALSGHDLEGVRKQLVVLMREKTTSSFITREKTTSSFNP